MTSRDRRRSSPRHTRRGSTYILALMVALVVTAMGVGGALAAQSTLAAANLRVQGIQTRLAAQSALELGVAQVQNTKAWRSGAYAAAGGFASGTIGSSTYRVAIDAPAGGAPGANRTDPIRLTATATRGASRHGMRAVFNPVLVTPDALSAAAFADGNVSLGFAAAFASNASIACNGSMTAVAAFVNADAFAKGSILGATYSGAMRSAMPARTLPDPVLVDELVAGGTAIPFASLSSGKLQNGLLAPVSNPYGATNASGIYVVDCGGSTITVRNCRVYGTLVLLNTGASSRIDQSVSFQPLVRGGACLVVKGPITISTSNADVDESSPGMPNLNPTGAPYYGATNATSTDRYPCLFEGIVYATGSVTLSGSVAVAGNIVAGGGLDIVAAANVHVTAAGADATPTTFKVTDRFALDPATLERVTY